MSKAISAKQHFPHRDAAIRYRMERFRDRKRLIAAMQQFALLFRQRRSYTPVTSIGRGMTASEIARSLKRTPGSIYSRLQRLYRGQRS